MNKEKVNLFIMVMFFTSLMGCSVLPKVEIVAKILMNPTTFFHHASPKFEWIKDNHVMHITYGNCHPDSEGGIYSSIMVSPEEVNYYSVRLKTAIDYNYVVEGEKKFSAFMMTNTFTNQDFIILTNTNTYTNTDSSTNDTNGYTNTDPYDTNGYTNTEPVTNDYTNITTNITLNISSVTNSFWECNGNFKNTLSSGGEWYSFDFQDQIVWNSRYENNLLAQIRTIESIIIPTNYNSTYFYIEHMYETEKNYDHIYLTISTNPDSAFDLCDNITGYKSWDGDGGGIITETWKLDSKYKGKKFGFIYV